MTGSQVETTPRQPTHERLDPLLFRPRPHPDVVVRRLESRRHGSYYMLKNPHGGAYLRLGVREHELLGLMDGHRTITEIAVEGFYRHRTLMLEPVTRLVELLHREGFLATAPVAAASVVSWPPDGPAKRAGRLVARLLWSEITLPGTDAFVTRLWESVGWLLLARPALALYGLVAVGGLLTLLASSHLGEIRLVNLFAPHGIAVLLLAVLFVPVLVFTHEMAHALVCKSFGREVRRGGFALYFGIPVFFVDTTDIWLENRRRRIAVSAAGLVADLTIGGACALLAQALPASAAATVLLLASIAYFGFVCNLVPLAKLDGYYILVDLLEMPMLMPRSFAFVRKDLIGKLRRRERFNREELLLTCYGLLAGAVSVLLLVYVIRLLQIQLTGLIGALGGGSWLMALLALILLMRFGIPLLLRAAGALTRAARAVTHSLRIAGR